MPHPLTLCDYPKYEVYHCREPNTHLDTTISAVTESAPPYPAFHVKHLISIGKTGNPLACTAGKRFQNMLSSR